MRSLNQYKFAHTWARQAMLCSIAAIVALTPAAMFTAIPSADALAPIATTLGQGTVGHDANVPGLHTPAVLTPYNGDYTTTADGEVIQNLDISGRITVLHANVVIRDVKTKKIRINVKATPTASAHISWTTVGSETGLDPEIWQHGAVTNGNFTLHRSNVYGSVDAVQLTCGQNTVTENWLHDLYRDTTDPGQNNGPSHTDPIQFIPDDSCATEELALHNNVIKDNKIEAWTFGPGQTAGQTRGDISSPTSTSGLALVTTASQQQPAPKDTYITNNYVDGNYDNAFYAITASNAGPNDNAQNLVITDNVFKQRYPNYGKVKYGSVSWPPTGGTIQLTHGRNTDADTGAEIPLACGLNCSKPPIDEPVPTPEPLTYLDQTQNALLNNIETPLTQNQDGEGTIEAITDGVNYTSTNGQYVEHQIGASDNPVWDDVSEGWFAFDFAINDTEESWQVIESEQEGDGLASRALETGEGNLKLISRYGTPHSNAPDNTWIIKPVIAGERVQIIGFEKFGQGNAQIQAWYRVYGQNTWTQFADSNNFSMGYTSGNSGRFHTRGTSHGNIQEISSVTWYGTAVMHSARDLAESAAGIVTVDPPVPATIALSGASNGQTLSESISIGANVENATSIEGVDFYVDNTLVNSDTAAPYYLGGDNDGVPTGWNTRNVANGSHQIKAIARYNAGSTVEATLSININNIPLNQLVQAENALSKLNTSLKNDTAASGGKALALLNTNSYVAHTFTAPHTAYYTVGAVMRSVDYKGSANVAVYVDDKKVTSKTLTKTYSTLNVTGRWFTAGSTHEIKFVYTNDLSDKNGNRDLYVDTIFMNKQ